ncbi:Abi family protein [Ellagibacter isourolithinifaciens]|uniref:Abi family protein n=1 Tax=Ellagibacter isourolithinifaciens TaxID=2137581 RepID=A0A6N6NKA2_9ACTN|nr:Abi family protein [Ellagibacter isourolithinifaciens]
MGTIKLLYQKVSPDARTKTASELGTRVPVLKNWLSVPRVARSACCHHSRIWNRTWGVRPVIPRN